MIRSLFKLYLIVVLSVAAAVAGIQYGLLPQLHQQLSEIERESSKTYNYLLARYLDQQDIRREAALARLQANASERFALIGMDDVLHLGERRLRDLRDGRQVFGNDGKDAYLPLRDGQILHAHREEVNDTNFQLTAYALIAFAILLAVVTWVFYHWRELNALQEAARQFGNGRLSTRARLSRRSNVYQLARQFDDMAACIEASMARQRAMIHGISHELKTPIARLEFGIALLRSCGDSAPDPSQRAQRLEALRLNVRELDELVTELLTLGQLEQGAVPLRLVPVTVREMVDSVAAIVSDDAAQRNLLLDVRSTGPYAHHLCDPRLVARALLNLCRNAVRNARGTVAVASRTDASGTLTLTVEDDGPGVPPEECERIFEPFHHAGAGLARHSGRFGLDLAIVRRIALAHGGQVSLGSGRSGGARFVITLPGPASDRRPHLGTLPDN